MANVIRHGFKRRHASHYPAIALILALVVLLLGTYPFVSQFLPGVSSPLRARIGEVHRAPQKIDVVDGDTVRVESLVYRLVGFNTPESGANAECRAERALADKATRRLRALLASGEPHLQKVRCACPPGTEGTQYCNHGRLCGVMTVSGVDVGETMIAEGLAERYICRGTSCPPRRGWCS